MGVQGSREEFSVLMGRLDEALNATPLRHDGVSAARLSGFARHFYAHASLEELGHKSTEDLHGMTLALWEFIQRVPAGGECVRVFNPDFDHCGWHSTHTIVELVSPDRPFLVDSISIELNRRGLTVHSVIAESYYATRDANGALTALQLRHEEGGGRKEALLHVELDRQSDAAALADIRGALEAILGELACVVDDFMPMVKHVIGIAEGGHFVSADDDYSSQDVREFLFWLTGNHFTFLGMCDYALVDDHWHAVGGSARGLARHEGGGVLALTEGGQRRGDAVLVFAKSPVRSRIHRPVYMDMVCVRQWSAEGKLLTETRIVGLFTSRVFNNSPVDFPLLAPKLRTVLRQSGIESSSHDGKRMMQILETFPREELFLMSAAELLRIALGVLHLQDRRRLRMFLRSDVHGHFISCLIYAPRENFTTGLRRKFQSLLGEYFRVLDMEFHTLFTESNHVRLHVLIRVRELPTPPVDERDIETRMVTLARSWSDRLEETLIEHHGEERSAMLMSRYGEAFPVAYQEEFGPRAALSDIGHMERLSAVDDLEVSLYRTLDDENSVLRFKIFRLGASIAFSDVLPMLENLGFRVLGGQPYIVERRDDVAVWLYDFSVRDPSFKVVDLASVRQTFEQAFERIWRGDAENDSFNRLTLAVGLSWREVSLLRAIAQYCRQIRFPFSQSYIKDALVANPGISRALIELFECRFKPGSTETAAESGILARINSMLEKVASLDQDRILRRYLDVMGAMLRTNYYCGGGSRDYISFKLESGLISGLPKPVPLYEVFVYSPRVEGIHLRGGKVARGGIRWSDRREDFRTEVLGLVKAQQVKNAVIVPVGAKGGFYPKRLPRTENRDLVLDEAISAYKTFIRGLLDITDNIVDGVVVGPVDVVRRDGDDPYLVVAADKGTASFSDIANGVAAEYGFWLGDAFASGGSAGYDHKKMAITARGAWVSVQRHFRQLGIDVQTQPITMVGIGDMSGDVFGNGLLQSSAVKLLAAFDHRHVFIDPDPDPRASFAERRRLFDLPRSSWADYRQDLVSAGGGVYNRGAKFIVITPQMRDCFGIDADRLTPAELISALLRAPVDLIWNGGIGTYIKSSRETHADVGDKSNEAVRVNGCEVGARVVAEGGNLGMTQSGRIEYSLKGGLCNTDFIDNSGGVDCSDHEVNIKILLNAVVANGDMTLKQRNQLLAEMTDEVASLVLADNDRQTQCITLARAESVYRLGEYRRYIHTLERAGRLDRQLEFIPSDEELSSRQLNNSGLMRPELATLLSYTKAILKDELVHSSLPDDPYVTRERARAFPARMAQQFPAALQTHKLGREIVATQVANGIVNYMGITFVYRMAEATGSASGDIARAFVAARDVFGLEYWWQQLENATSLSSTEQNALLGELVRLVRRATRWFLRACRNRLSVEDIVLRFRPGVDAMINAMPDVFSGTQRTRWELEQARWCERGLSGPLARHVASLPMLFAALAISQAAESTHRSVGDVASVYFAIGERLGLDSLYQEINALPVHNHWQALAREGYRDDLDWQQRALTVGVLNGAAENTDVPAMIAGWAESQSLLIDRWERVLADVRSTDNRELAMYGVVLRELMDLAQNTLQAGTP